MLFNFIHVIEHQDFLEALVQYKVIAFLGLKRTRRKSKVSIREDMAHRGHKVPLQEKMRKQHPSEHKTFIGCI